MFLSECRQRWLVYLLLQMAVTLNDSLMFCILILQHTFLPIKFTLIFSYLNYYESTDMIFCANRQTGLATQYIRQWYIKQVDTQINLLDLEPCNQLLMHAL